MKQICEMSLDELKTYQEYIEDEFAAMDEHPIVKHYSHLCGLKMTLCSAINSLSLVKIL